MGRYTISSEYAQAFVDLSRSRSRAMHSTRSSALLPELLDADDRLGGGEFLSHTSCFRRCWRARPTVTLVMTNSHTWGYFDEPRFIQIVTETRWKCTRVAVIER